MFKSVTAKTIAFAQSQTLQRTSVVTKRWHPQAQEYRGGSQQQQYPKINVPYQPAKLDMPTFTPKDNTSSMKYSSVHDTNDAWDHETVVNKLQNNSLFTWGARDPMYVIYHFVLSLTT